MAYQWCLTLLVRYCYWYCAVDSTTTPAGKAMFQMLGVFAEFERSIIRERVKAGLDRARAQGKQLGRPRTSLTVEKKIRKRRADGAGIHRIAKELEIGVSVVQRVIQTK